MSGQRGRSVSRNYIRTLASVPQTGGCGRKSAQAWARHPGKEKDHFRQMDCLLHRLPWEHPSPTPAAQESHVAGSPLLQSFCWPHQTQTQPPAPLPARALVVPVGGHRLAPSASIGLRLSSFNTRSVFQVDWSHLFLCQQRDPHPSTPFHRRYFLRWR